MMHLPVPLPGFLIRFSSLAAIVALCSGCTFIQATEKDPFIDAAVYKANPPQTIAIAHFDNESATELAGEKLRQALYEEMSSLGYLDVELPWPGRQ